MTGPRIYPRRGDLSGVGGSMRGLKPVVVTAPKSSSWLEQALANASLLQQGYASPDRPSVAPKTPMTRREVLRELLLGAGRLAGNPAADAHDAYGELGQGHYGMAGLAALGAIPLVGEGRKAVRALSSGVAPVVGRIGEGLKKMLGISGKTPLVQAGREGIEAGREGIEAGREGIDVFHASPVRGINKFGLEYVNTGQGAQAQGHGLYFAELDEVARNYLPETGGLYKTRLHVKPDELLDLDKTLGEQSDYVKRVLKGMPEAGDAVWQSPNTLFPSPLHGSDPATRTGEDIYRNIVEIVTRARWKAAQRQLDDFLNGVAGSSDPGESSLRAHQAAASKALKDAGIPGIRYLDQQSRGYPKGPQTSNYVMFDPKRIEILKMLGLAGVGAFGAKKANDAR